MSSYNVYCTQWGCTQGVFRDDVDNGWPSWQNAVFTPQPVVNGSFAFRPQEYPWRYLQSDARPQAGSFCGPHGCGPVQPLRTRFQ